jgi:hypothetical protein
MTRHIETPEEKVWWDKIDAYLAKKEQKHWDDFKSKIDSIDDYQCKNFMLRVFDKMKEINKKKYENIPI